MNEEILKHYLEFSVYTNPGLYQEKLKKDLPDDVREIGLLVRKNLIHRSTLKEGNTGTNADLRFGDMTQVPWYRQPEDDILVTAAAMLAELYRRDELGLTMDRHPADKIVVTCRFSSVLTASILKSKGIPCRCRNGFAPYFKEGSWEHWINQYWDEKEKRWVNIDVDGGLSFLPKCTFDAYDMPGGKFDWAADTWLGIRAGRLDPNHFWNGKPEKGAIVVLWAIFYDFHALMNNEIIYTYGPKCGYGTYEKFNSLTEEELKRVDDLALLMKNPDENFEQLQEIWETEKDFRLLIGSLL